MPLRILHHTDGFQHSTATKAQLSWLGLSHQVSQIHCFSIIGVHTSRLISNRKSFLYNLHELLLQISVVPKNETVSLLFLAAH